jgi:hypothetical protein
MSNKKFNLRGLSLAAKILGISTQTLRRKLKKEGSLLIEDTHYRIVKNNKKNRYVFSEDALSTLEGLI